MNTKVTAGGKGAGVGQRTDGTRIADAGFVANDGACRIVRQVADRAACIEDAAVTGHGVVVDQCANRTRDTDRPIGPADGAAVAEGGDVLTRCLRENSGRATADGAGAGNREGGIISQHRSGNAGADAYIGAGRAGRDQHAGQGQGGDATKHRGTKGDGACHLTGHFPGEACAGGFGGMCCRHDRHPF